MTAPTNFNLQAYRGRTFQGFVQFQIPDGSTWYRLKERQAFTFSLAFQRASHYDDAGKLALDPSGIGHTFNLSVKLTSDMFDTSFSSSADKKTITYWMKKSQDNEPVEIIFVTSFQTLDSSDNKDYINIKFKLMPNSFSSGLGASGGSPTLDISGNILEITDAIRTTTNEQ